VVERPEDIVNSIAVYKTGKVGNYAHKIDKTKYTQDQLNQMVINETHFSKENEKKEVEYYEYDIKYMAGKMAHINRIKAIDANGDWTWCDQNIADSVWTKTCPQEWLDGASYPVRIDPTFGYTTAGGSNFGGGANKVCGDAWTVGSDMTVSSLSVYIKKSSADMHVKGLVSTYIDYYSGNLLTGGKGGAVTVSSTTYSWKTSNFSSPPSLSNGNTYGITVVEDNGCFVAYDNGITTNVGGFSGGAQNYTSPGNFDGETYWTDFGYEVTVSIYATYTASGGAARRVIITE
jgi:hypothetical protein